MTAIGVENDGSRVGDDGSRVGNDGSRVGNDGSRVGNDGSRGWIPAFAGMTVVWVEMTVVGVGGMGYSQRKVRLAMIKATTSHTANPRKLGHCAMMESPCTVMPRMASTR